MKKQDVLARAVSFHGHLGPFLVLGLKAGTFALKKLKAEKYFVIQVAVKGALRKPKSCLIDGLQLSTGATYGKGNIRKLGGRQIEVIFKNLKTSKKLVLKFRKDLLLKLGRLKTHKDSQRCARGLYKVSPQKLFKLT